MTFKFLTGLILATGQLVALAQTGVQTPSALDATAERERISRERGVTEASYTRSESACYSRFAVSDCLSEARKQRRLAMDELRRQELILNDMDRKTKAVEALKRIQTNVAAQQEKLEKDAQSETQP